MALTQGQEISQVENMDYYTLQIRSELVFISKIWFVYLW